MNDQAYPAQQLVTRTGLAFEMRAVRPEDELLLADFFRQVTPEDLRFRFMTSVREVSHAQLAAMRDVDHQHTETFLAIAPGEGTPIAVGMLAADSALERGEVALSIRPEFKAQGISWKMLEQMVSFAEAHGLATLESIESRENVAAITLEREMGFVAEPVEDDPTEVILRLHLRQARD